MKKTEEFLLKLLETQSVSGSEAGLAPVLDEFFAETTDCMLRDKLGSVIYKKAGRAEGCRRIMLAAHADEVGFMVTDILEGGFLRLAPMGGIRAPAARELLIYGKETIKGVTCIKPPHILGEKDAKKLGDVSEHLVFTGYTVEQLRGKVEIGDLAVPCAAPIKLMGERLAARGLDDKSGLALMYDVSQRLAGHGSRHEKYYAATAQEEVGLRGAATAASLVNPDLAIVLDVTYADSREASTAIELGGGPAVALGGRVSAAFAEKFRAVCDEYRIKCQYEPSPASTGTDADAIQITQQGIPCVIISIPLRNMHAPAEVLDLKELDAIGQAVALFICELDDFDWEYDVCI